MNPLGQTNKESVFSQPEHALEALPPASITPDLHLPPAEPDPAGTAALPEPAAPGHEQGSKETAMTRLPLLATLLGLAGLLPFLASGFASVTHRAAWGMPALIGYGAVVLAFLGAVHWGLALAPQQQGAAKSQELERARLLLGVVPALVGWAALLVPARWAALILLIAGFIGTLVVEAAGHRRLVVPPGYMWLRWILSVAVVAILTTVLVLRLIGASITL